jgi:hypothetical protein
MASNGVQDIVKMMEDWFSKLPALPKNVNEVIVKITPWIALIFGVLGILSSIALFGISTVAAPFLAMGGYAGQTGGGMIAAILALVSSVLMVAAFPGTNKRKLSGWTLLFYSEIVSVIASVVMLSVGGLVGNLIGFYILFQIKSYYK